jgi:hypothetical protein
MKTKLKSRATNKTCGLGQALDVGVVSHRCERTRRKKEYELEQQSNRRKHAFAPTTSKHRMGSQENENRFTDRERERV